MNQILDELLEEKLTLEAIEEKAFLAMLEEENMTEKDYARQVELEELKEKLFTMKVKALKEFKKAKDALYAAYDCIAKYNSDIDFYGANELIDADFCSNIDKKVQECSTYTQWITDETSAMEREAVMAAA